MIKELDDLGCCRSCGHFQFAHTTESGYLKTAASNWIVYCDPQTDHGCGCEEFIPENNLSYLEYLYDKKKNLKNVFS